MNRFLSASLLIAMATIPVTVLAEEFLPTPYTAEQIGNAWRQGYEMTMKIWTPDRETVSRTRVEGWSREAIETSEQQLDDTGSPVGDKTVSSSSWEDLRDHARFPVATTVRERTTRVTALGELEGWLYTVSGDEGRVSEFFFADDFPGPPVEFSQTNGDSVIFRAETIAVKPAP
ncbi:MAG: hypothetical protein P8Y44_13435 [Acidobacteriota bacterium]